MIQSRSYTSAINASREQHARAGRDIDAAGVLAPAGYYHLLLLLLIGGALALRLLRLAWQPLWWDEGYSIYFATEPLARMLWLTAHDIHPPRYYALLHGWFALLDSTRAESARLF